MAVTQTGRIVLLGVARSGTTWLASAMGHARSTRVVREPDNVDADPQGRAVGRMGFGPYPIIDRGTDSPQFRALWDVSFSGRVPNRRGARRAAGMVMRRLPRALREPLFRRTARTLAALPGRAPHVVVKSTYGIFAIDWLLDNYGPRVVVLQRHPLNVIASWVDVGIHGFDLLDRPLIRERFLDPLVIAPLPRDASQLEIVAEWVGLLAFVLSQQVARHPEWLVVTHEDLCVDPPVRIRSVCEQLGLEWTEAADGFVRDSNRPGEGFSQFRRFSDLPERWRQRFSDDEIVRIEAVLRRFPSAGWVRGPAAVAPDR